MSRRWYIVGTYSGYENSVKQDLERRMETMNMKDKIYQVIVPEESTEVTDKKGKKKIKVTKMFPGYVFVEIEVEKEMDDQVWFMIRNTPKVTGFLGSSGGGAKPVPLPNDEIIPILKQCGLKLEIQVDFKVGDVVNVVSGTFAGQEATVESFDVEKQIVTVLVDFFGRQTPQELRFDEVEVIK